MLGVLCLRHVADLRTLVHRHLWSHCLAAAKHFIFARRVHYHQPSVRQRRRTVCSVHCGSWGGIVPEFRHAECIGDAAQCHLLSDWLCVQRDDARERRERNADQPDVYARAQLPASSCCVADENSTTMLLNNNPEPLATCGSRQLLSRACRLNGVFMYFVANVISTPNPVGATFGSLVFTFSPPVNGFSFLLRNFNAQSNSNRSQISVTTGSGNVTLPVPIQTDGDVNFVGWYQANSSVSSVALSPLTYNFPASQYGLAMALDELRVYTQSPPSNFFFSLDNCATDAPLYPNGAAMESSFIAATLRAGFVASLQTFDSEIAGTNAPSFISFPTGSAFNGSVNITVVNATLISQTCKHICASPEIRFGRRQPDHEWWISLCVRARPGDWCDVCRLNNVFLFLVPLGQTFTSAATYGSLVLTFSPPVSGFSVLLRDFNAQIYSNNTKIIVTTTTAGSVVYSVPTQTDGDINFIGWFQANSSVSSVAFSPWTYRFSSIQQYASVIALDELRVYTQAPPTNFFFSLDNCVTDAPLYPNGAAMEASFIESTVAAGFATSLQTFDSNAAGTNASSLVFFPAGSAYNGSVQVTVVNATLSVQTCQHYFPQLQT